MTFGEKMKYLRFKTQKTLKEQSELLGVKLGTLYRWESDYSHPRKLALVKIAAYFGVSPDWLSSDVASVSLTGEIECRMLAAFRLLPNGYKLKTVKYIEALNAQECVLMDEQEHEDVRMHAIEHMNAWEKNAEAGF